MMTDIAIIHVRFASDGTVAEISERPSPLSPQQWFKELSDAAPTLYQALAGGRGIFRLSRQQLESAREKALAGAAA
ncbi:hypothetical protein [Methylocystis sp. B8]|uniref:hypothetical protein n=1 Tax=Methylocystis sp. B8 TaxID=544938 RepID=UPI0010FE0F7B|nr:hypothetical protein [Methylocystis sp. B8]TLG71140.1 hypothetical protein FEV16_16640 [Methylocystis sp. B8]